MIPCVVTIRQNYRESGSSQWVSWDTQPSLNQLIASSSPWGNIHTAEKHIFRKLLQSFASIICCWKSFTICIASQKWHFSPNLHFLSSLFSAFLILKCATFLCKKCIKSQFLIRMDELCCLKNKCVECEINCEDICDICDASFLRAFRKQAGWWMRISVEKKLKKSEKLEGEGGNLMIWNMPTIS